MADQLGTLGAALIGFAGVFVGLIFGRRQVADQAQVEHGQWLRALRQGAYVELLDTWDTAIRETKIITARDYSDVENEREWDAEIVPYLHEEAVGAWTPVWRAIERVEISGPESVAKAVDKLRDAGEMICDAVLDFSGPWPHEQRVRFTLDHGRRARRLTLTAISDAIQTAPQPKPRTGAATTNRRRRIFRGRRRVYRHPSITPPAPPWA